MIEFLLWIFFGTLSGWIGYLVTRTSESSYAAPYIITGSLGAIVGGYATRDIGGGGQYALNPTNLFIALASAVVCVGFISFFGRVSPN